MPLEKTFGWMMLALIPGIGAFLVFGERFIERYLRHSEPNPFIPGDSEATVYRLREEAKIGIEPKTFIDSIRSFYYASADSQKNLRRAVGVGLMLFGGMLLIVAVLFSLLSS